MIFFIALGWTGTGLYIINHAYITSSAEYNTKVYYSVNAIAALFVLACSISFISVQSAIINLFWLIVSIASLNGTITFRVYLGKKLLNLTIFCLIFCAIILSNKSLTISFALCAWLSTIIFCFGYLLFSNKQIYPRQYYFYNFLAAGLIIPQLLNENNLPVVALEIIWAFLSCYGWCRRNYEIHIMGRQNAI